MISRRTISPQTWLDTFFPGEAFPEGKRFTPFSVDFKADRVATLENLCREFAGILEGLGNDEFTMRRTGQGLKTPTKRGKNIPEPTIAMYRTDSGVSRIVGLLDSIALRQERADAQNADQRSSPSTSNSSSEDEEDETAKPPISARRPHARAVWAAAEFVVEVMFEGPVAPSARPRHDEYRSPSISLKGQLSIEYAYHMLHRQHRCFVPIITIHEGHARFLLFDRAGEMLSHPFNYVERPEILATFVYRYLNASRAGRGFDPTARPASEAEVKAFKSLVDRYADGSHVRRELAKAASPGWPVHRISFEAQWSSGGDAVRDDSSHSSRDFLVGRPTFLGGSLVGRSTRGFVGWDLARERVVFIKDYWRRDRPLSLTEHQAYLRLSSGVEDGEETYIPTLLGGGDVAPDGVPQRTVTQDLIQQLRDDIGTTVRRVHTRLVFKEVCRDLRSFKDARELASAVYDALKGHQRAWEKHNLLHSDLSVGNILIYEKGGFPEPEVVGLLCDWELAKEKARVLSPQASPVSHSGTWQFMSAALLNYPAKPHVLSDDLESVLHILNWCALRYLPHKFSGPDMSHQLEDHVHFLYDVRYSRGIKGSYQKLLNVLDGAPFVRELPRNHPFDGLLRGLSEVCREHYERAPPKELERLMKNGDYEEVRQLIVAPEYYCESPSPGSAVIPKPPLVTTSSGTTVHSAISFNDDPPTSSVPSAKPPPLYTHDSMLSVFHTYLHPDLTWPAMEKLDVQAAEWSSSSSSLASEGDTDESIAVEVDGRAERSAEGSRESECVLGRPVDSPSKAGAFGSPGTSGNGGAAAVAPVLYGCERGLPLDGHSKTELRNPHAHVSGCWQAQQAAQCEPKEHDTSCSG